MSFLRCGSDTVSYKTKEPSLRLQKGAVIARGTAEYLITSSDAEKFIIEPESILVPVLDNNKLAFKKLLTDSSITVDIAGNQVYDGNEKKPVIVKDDEMPLMEGVDYAVAYSNNINATTEASKAVAEINSMGGYTGKRTIEFSIAKAATEITTIPQGKTLIYNGRAQALASEGVTTYGTLMYALKEDNGGAPETGWGTAVPEATNAGTYYIWYKVDGASNYTSVAPASVTTTIEKADWGSGLSPLIERSYLNSTEAGDEISLAGYLPKDCGRVTWGSPVTEGDAGYKAGPAVSEDGTLSYTLNAVESATRGTITITAETQNYAGQYVFTVNVRRDKIALYEKEAEEDFTLCRTKRLITGKSFSLYLRDSSGKDMAESRTVWVSDNPDIAAVTHGGRITAVSAGTTVISAKIETEPGLYAEAKCEVNVSESVAGITLDRSRFSFGKDETVTLTAVVLPSAASQKIRWSSSNASVVALCGENGASLEGTQSGTNNNIVVYNIDARTVTVKATGTGKATVTAEAADGSGKKASCSFTVGKAVPAFTVKAKDGKNAIAVGKTLQMSVDWGGKKLTPANTGIVWTVVDKNGNDIPDIASISSKGA